MAITTVPVSRLSRIADWKRARAGYDRNHRLVGTVNYELPFGLNKKWATSGWKKYAFGGLEISAIQTFESGNPLNFSYSNSPYNYYPGFAGNARPDVVSQMEIRDGWVDLGGDRFNKGNSNSVFTGDNNGLSNFALPGGCPAVIPANFDRTQCDFRVGNAGRNIVTGTPLRWTTISAQKNFQFSEKWKAQLRWDMQNAFKTFNFNNPDTTVDFRNPTELRQGDRRSDDRIVRWSAADEPHADDSVLTPALARAAHVAARAFSSR